MVRYSKSALFHSDVYIPCKETVDKVVRMYQENFKEYVLSKHLQERLLNTNKDRSHNYLSNVLNECLKTIQSNPRDYFEIELSQDNKYFNDNKWHITKYCIRIPYNKNEDLALSIRPEFSCSNYSGNNLVVTAWINHKDDDHSTLNYDKYCSEEQWKVL